MWSKKKKLGEKRKNGSFCMVEKLELASLTENGRAFIFFFWRTKKTGSIVFF